MYGVGWGLLGLVAGYWVLERAETNKGNLKRLGRVIGWLVITASFIGAICRVYCVATGTMCPLDGKGSWKYQKGLSFQEGAGVMSGNVPAGETKRK